MYGCGKHHVSAKCNAFGTPLGDSTPHPHSHLGEVRSVNITDEVPPLKYIGDVRLWETPYKHVVRHAVTEEALPHTRTSGRCGQ